MSRGPRRTQKSAGAFIGPNISVGVPVRTLSDEYSDRPAYAEDEHVPEPEPRGLVRRLFDRLVRRFSRDR